MKQLIILAVILAGSVSFAAAEGCGGGTTGTGGTGGTGGTTTHSSTTGSTSSTGTGGKANPPVPTLGMQIDRMGRPAINTALNHAFDPTMGTKNAAKDTYNQDADPTKWQAAYAGEIAKNLAILDGLDTVCGNQLLATAVTAGMPIPATRYAGLAGALADDRLYIKTDAATCTTYLAVEANATGALANMDCGGRSLPFDVIDESYSVLAAGALMGVGDGVAADADTAGTTFPYLAAPH